MLTRIWKEPRVDKPIIQCPSPDKDVVVLLIDWHKVCNPKNKRPNYWLMKRSRKDKKLEDKK